jgi:biotin synthase
MDREWYQQLTNSALDGELQPTATYRTMLTDEKIQLLQLLDAAFQVREHYHGRQVTIHIINNAQNGLCSEDCSYCAQAKTSKAAIAKYTTKSDIEIMSEARQAYEAGAHRHCLVYAGRGMNLDRIKHLCTLIQEIKHTYPLEVCVSAGILDQEAATLLKEAGLDRLNHNLNTAASRYDQICSTHTFADRLNTLHTARRTGLEVCSGIIAGMGETVDELIELALILREINARSIPINFLLAIPGTTLTTSSSLSPQYCLKILCLFRFINPDAEIRMAAGREEHLRSMEVMGLYPTNSLFMDGYLNTRGNSRKQTLEMIRDAGFTIKSDLSIEEILQQEQEDVPPARTRPDKTFIKTVEELRPGLS